MLNFLITWDQFLFWRINNLAGHYFWLDALMVFFASFFQYYVALALLAFYWLGKDETKIKNRLMVINGFLSALVSRFFLTEIIRYFIHRDRPFVVLENVKQLVNHEIEFSFPSGHAAFMFGLAFMVWFYNKKAGWYFLVAAGLISIARVYVGVHFLLDIIAGAGVGYLGAWLVKRFGEKYIKKFWKN